MPDEIEPFVIGVDAAALDDLRDRLRRARWPEREPVADWSQGVPLGYLQELCGYWAGRYDWRAAEAQLNQIPQFTTTIDGLDVHFVHIRSAHPGAVPLVMTHGWPRSFLEFEQALGPLTGPAAHGGDPADAFDVVVPSLPGYGFSGKPSATGWDIHRMLISVVGADRIPQVSVIDRAFFGYFGMKLATERIVEQSGIGWTTLRATQFHDLILMVARTLARLPVIPAPTGSRFQPVDATEVAERLAQLALGQPSGLVPDLAGPKIYTLAELVKSYLSAVGKRRPLVPVHIPGQAVKALRSGANLAPDRAVGKRTWEEFLADRT
jgi:pimeloyl-ACP methyl ester carboxylesterase